MTTYNWQAQLPALEAQYRIPAGLLGALIRAESGGRQDAVSPVGAIGLGQLMPATARALGVDPRDPAQNLKGAAMYLSQQLRQFGGDVNKTLAAYNAGPGAVKKYNGIPPYRETQDYVKRVTGYWQESSRYGQQAGATAPMVAGVAPVAPVRKTVPGTDQGSLNKLAYLYADEPTIGNAIANQRIQKQNAMDGDFAKAAERYNINNQAYNATAIGSNALGAASAGKSGWFKTPNGFVQNIRPGEKSYQFLQRLGTKGFGLLNDPGSSQTTGGQHAENSWHYREGAVDFGDARNPWDKLNNYYSWVNARKKQLGITELLNEGDHIHTASNLGG